MKVERGRISLADLLGIQVLRRLDQNQPSYCADIDAPLAAEAARDHRGHLKQPVRVLASRADQVLQTRHGVNPGWLGEVIGWLRVVRFLGYLLILVIAFGLAEPWLREGQVINVEWLFGFLGTLVVSMTITTVLMVLAIFTKKKGEDAPDAPPSGGPAKSFAKLLVVHWLMQFVLRRMVPWIERRLLKRSSDKSQEEIKRIENVTECLYDTLSQQSRRTALEAAATSNTVWCLLSIGVLLSLGKMGLFREYDFHWGATIVSQDFMRETTQLLARPLAGLPLAGQPTEADVKWLATDDKETAGEDHHAHRQLWGRLFLAYLLYYGVLPRFVLTIISRWLAARGWRGLTPDLSDPYFKSIVENIEKPPFESSLEEQESEEAESESVAPAILHSQPQSTPVAEETDPQDQAAKPVPVGTKTAVFSYDVPEPSEGWPQALSLGKNGAVINLGNAGDRASRKQTSDKIGQCRQEIGLLVIVANLVDNPDGLFTHFIRETVDHLHPQAGRSLVLIGGERLRQRYEGDASKIADRIALWKQKGCASGIEGEKILEFDLEHATTAARQLLTEKMRSFQPAGRARTARTSTGLQSAGLFRKATSVVIMSHINEDTAAKPPDELRQVTLEVHEQLRSLYRKQASALEKAFANVHIDTNRIRSAVSEKARAAHNQFDKLEEFSRMTAVVQRYTQGLSGKWAVGGGVVCALGSGALAALAAPALLPALIPAAAFGAQAGLLGGAISAHAPHLAAKLRLRGTKPETDAEELTEDENQEAEFSLDDLVRSSTLLALILELQGNPEDRIAHTLETILHTVSEEDLTTPEAASRWLGHLADRTDSFLAKHSAD